MDDSAIVARDLGVRRGGRWLLRPASFGIAGGVIGIAGPAGAGTSALLATFATLRRPTSGSLEILGHDTGNSARLRAVRTRIGYLPPDARWAAGMTVHDFVSYAAYYKRMPPRAVRRVLAGLDLSDVASLQLGRLPADLRVRAGLAAACVHEPELLLLDRPLRGLTAREADDLVPVLGLLAPTVVATGDDDLSWTHRTWTLNRGKLETGRVLAGV